MVAAPTAALLVSGDALNFGLVQTFMVMFLVIGLLGLAAAWFARRQTRARKRRLTLDRRLFAGEPGAHGDAVDR